MGDNFIEDGRSVIERAAQRLHELTVRAAPRATAAELVQLAKWREALEELLHERKPAQERAVRGSTISGYRIEREGPVEILTEYRHGGGQPFRCPRGVYDATAEVLKIGEFPGMYFDEILFLLNERMQERQPDYLPRICLRYWQWTNPRLVLRDRGRYRPESVTNFIELVERSWEQLKHQKQGA